VGRRQSSINDPICGRNLKSRELTGDYQLAGLRAMSRAGRFRQQYYNRKKTQPDAARSIQGLTGATPKNLSRRRNDKG